MSIKISALPAASNANAGDELVANQSGTSRKVTALQMANYARTIAGSVLQVVSASYSTEVVLSGSTWTDTGLTASITPSSASNKVLVLTSVPVLILSSTNSAFGGLRLVRASTPILSPADDGVGFFDTGVGAGGAVGAVSTTRHAMSKLDSPNTTSSVAYKVQMIGYSAGDDITSCPNDSEATITLMEIAG